MLRVLSMAIFMSTWLAYSLHPCQCVDRIASLTFSVAHSSLHNGSLRFQRSLHRRFRACNHHFIEETCMAWRITRSVKEFHSIYSITMESNIIDASTATYCQHRHEIWSRLFTLKQSTAPNRLSPNARNTHCQCYVPDAMTTGTIEPGGKLAAVGDVSTFADKNSAESERRANQRCYGFPLRRLDRLRE